MQDIANSFIDTTMQCWACPIFDRLFNIISQASAAAYQRLSTIGIIIFCVLFAFYILNTVWNNIKSDNPEPFYKKSIQSTFINSLIALTLLGTGIYLPRLITTITAEPVATITQKYSEAMLPSEYNIPTSYKAITLSEDGFFRPQLRDKILLLIQTSVANFQSYIKLGVAIIDEAFSLKALLGIGSLIKHIILCFIGIFLTKNFFELFIKYTFCFIDVIVAMALFAFMFPIALVLFAFKDNKTAPKWMANLGKNLGGSQIKNIINAIVSIGAAVLTYTVINLIIRSYFTANDITSEDLINYVVTEQDFFNLSLENSDFMNLTLMGCIVLVYVINYLADQIPNVSKTILSAFNVSENNSLSKEMGENMLKLTNIAIDNAKKIVKTIINPDSVKTADTKEEKKEDKKEGKK